jgi:DNA-binding transcriptional MerR regulator
MYNLRMDKNKEPFKITHLDWFDSWLGEYLGENFSKIREDNRKRRVSISSTSQSYRVINHWSEEGLLLKQEGRGSGWRKFSLIDILWIGVIGDLRKLGYPLDKIKTVKKSLFHRTKNGKEDTLYFELFIGRMVVKDNVLLVITPEGEADLCLDREYINSQFFGPLPSPHVVIRLNEIFSRSVKKPELSYNTNFVISPSDKETNLLHSIMREKDLKEVRISVKDQKMSRIDYVKKTQNPEKVQEYISKALKEKGRKEILIKQEDGKVVLLERVDKK